LNSIKYRLLIIAAVSAIPLSQAIAHTTSVGYENAGPGAITFWYGTYHPSVNYTEGSFQLVGLGGAYSQTVSFDQLTNIKPTGLIDGTTNFYSDGSALVGTGIDIFNWQGVSFTNLQAGDYTFTYIPISSPTSTWRPTDSVILSSTVHLSAEVLGSTEPPPPPAPTIIDSSQGSFSETDPAASGSQITFDGGVFAPTKTLALDSPISLLANGGTIDTQQGELTLSSVISGAGGLTKEGAGVLRLSGANSYTGGTTVLAGTLVGDVATLHGQIDNRSAVAFDQATDGVFSGEIHGSGQLVKAGAGTLTLTGANTYTGGTTVLSGALVGDASTLHGQIDNRSVVAFNQTSDGAFSGEIRGAGQLVKEGAGALTLQGVNSFTGGVALNAGTLVLANDGALGQGALQAAGGTLRLGYVGGLSQNIALPQGVLTLDTGANRVVASGDLSGGGQLVKMGAGVLNLTGASAFTGPTSIAEGRLAVNGSLVGSTATVGAGGEIGGNGRIGGLIVKTNATAAPGNSIGQLSVATFVIFEPGSIYSVEVDAAGHGDRIAVSGQATLQGGTVKASAEAGAYQPTTTYRIIDADAGVVGRFAGATSNLAFLTPELSYSAKAVDLTLVRNDLAFRSVAVTANQRRAGAAVDGAFRYGTSVYDSLVRGTSDEARTAFDQLSGEAHAAGRSVALSEAAQLGDSVVDHLRANGAGASRSGWVQAISGWGRQGADDNGAAVKHSTRGLLLGAEASVAAGTTLGLAGAYSKGEASLDGRSGHVDSTSTQVFAYAAKALGPFTLRGGAGYGRTKLETERSVALRRLADRLTSDVDGSLVQGFAEVGYTAAAAGARIEPFAGLSALRLKTDSFAETGGATALKGKADGQDLTVASAGVRLDGALSAKGGYHLAVAVRRTLSGATPGAALAFQSGGPGFEVVSTRLDRTSLALKGGVSWRLSQRLRLEADYQGTTGRNQQAHTARLGLRMAF
jgi:outer membrane autotransporter protein